MEINLKITGATFRGDKTLSIRVCETDRYNKALHFIEKFKIFCGGRGKKCEIPLVTMMVEDDLTHENKEVPWRIIFEVNEFTKVDGRVENQSLLRDDNFLVDMVKLKARIDEISDDTSKLTLYCTEIKMKNNYSTSFDPWDSD